jgi:membrane-associated PAP2 superfamily phosphatase
MRGHWAWRAWVWGLAGLLAWDATGADRDVARLFGDASGFAARNAFWAEQVLHNGLRYVSIGVFVWMLWDLVRPAGAALPGAPTRTERAWAVGATVLALLLVPALKNHSLSSCPWSLAEFGGEAAAQWVSHWAWGERDGGPGACFPSGHAVGSLAFLSLVWLWRGRPRVARWVLGAVLLTGLLGSVAQWARGAHFVSHSLWSAYLCALITYSVQGLGLAWARRSSAGPRGLQGVAQGLQLRRTQVAGPKP